MMKRGLSLKPGSERAWAVVLTLSLVFAMSAGCGVDLDLCIGEPKQMLAVGIRESRDVWQRAAREALEPRLTLAAAGDVMFDRGVKTVCRRLGREWPLGAAAPILSAADVSFVNLETSLARGGQPIPGKGIWFRSEPEFALELKKGGVDVVALANNHVLDYDEPAFIQTLAALSQCSIAACGGGLNIDEARTPAVISAGGVSIAFLGYSELADIFWTYSYPRSFRAQKARPGVAPMDEKIIVEDVKRAKALADHVVVSFHWGEEYIRMPNPKQIGFAHIAVDAGASLVLGHHPHVLQPVEVYDGGVIFYSLGNFVFDQKKPDTVESMIARVSFSPGKVVSAEILPMKIEECRPRPLTGWAAQAALDRMMRDSARLGTIVARVGDRGLVVIPASAATAEAKGIGERIP
ncbi:MAG: CapA family protein [Firmicutes bacterium]|nr:CapA family protein [Bacillota bacterium]